VYTITEATDSNPATGHWDNTLVTGDFNGTAARVTKSTVTHTCTFTLNLTTDSDQTLECAFTNVQRGHVTLTKTKSGAVPGPNDSFEFTLNPGGQDKFANAGNGGVLDFGFLTPGSYTLCEKAVGPGWTSTWQLNGSPVTPTTDPNSGDICYTFNLAAGGTANFTIDNVPPPGGGQRTIGYWKNWNTLARSASFLAKHPDNAIVDNFVPSPIGTFGGQPLTLSKAVAILSNASTKYAEHGLAAQLLAAELNVAAGASPSCTNITSWIAHGEALLSGIPWTLTSTIVGNNHPQRADFVTTHGVLDAYNNGTCPAAPFV
jgi:hypothetical protein